jgi:hypothetical protein
MSLSIVVGHLRANRFLWTSTTLKVVQPNPF